MTIAAQVIALNQWQYLCNDGVGSIGQIQQIPCDASIVDAEYWAIPQKDDDIFTALVFQIYTGQPAPTYDSFLVFRLTDKRINYRWWIRGTIAQYKASCDVCCGNAPIPMPTDTPLIAPCQTLCEPVGSTPQAIFALPTLGAGQTYNPYGAYNNNPFPLAAAAGYASVTLLLNFLNSNWNPFTWTVSSDNLTLTATGGSVGDTVCGIIVPVYPSGYS